MGDTLEQDKWTF